MKYALLCFLLINALAVCAQKPFYYVSGKVVDPKTGVGEPGIYVALQGRYVSLFMGGPEYFEDLVLDSTDRQGNFNIKIPAHVVDSFSKEQGGLFAKYCFALDTRTARGPWEYELYNNLHTVSIEVNVTTNVNAPDTNSFFDRVYLNKHTRLITKENKPFREDLTGITMPFYKGGFFQFQLPPNDTSYRDQDYLIVSVQEVRKNGTIIDLGHTSYSKDEMNELTLVKPYAPLNIVLAKMPRGEFRIDTITIIKNVVVQPGEIKKIAVPVQKK